MLKAEGRKSLRSELGTSEKAAGRGGNGSSTSWNVLPGERSKSLTGEGKDPT